MVYSDVSNKNGIIQDIEFWTNLGDGVISGNATLLKVITSRVNESFNRIMPLVLAFSNFLSWDDQNNTDEPVGTFNIVSGQSDYTIAADANGLSIFNITNVRILTSATGTFYYELEEMTMDDPRAITAMSPNPTDIGVPVAYLKRGNTLFFWPQPNYAATAGAKIYFQRDPAYFTSADTTKVPGVPKPFHGLFSLYVSHDWLLVNKPDNTVLITRVETEIARREKDLRDAIKVRFPSRKNITSSRIRFR